MVLILYVGDCVISNPFKDKIDEIYASLLAYFRIENDGDLNKFLRIKLDRRPYGSIHLRQI